MADTPDQHRLGGTPTHRRRDFTRPRHRMRKSTASGATLMRTSWIAVPGSHTGGLRPRLHSGLHPPPAAGLVVIEAFTPNLEGASAIDLVNIRLASEINPARRHHSPAPMSV